MSKVIFVQDYYIEDIIGGAELHDQVVLEHFVEKDMLYDKKRTYQIDKNYVENNLDKVWFISNFVLLKSDVKALIAKKCKYIIYEHDYKFVDSRNPIYFKNFVVPERNKININFYLYAHKVVCLSKMHREIFEKNLILNNLENINCSMWSDKHLELFKNLLNNEKNQKFAVIDSGNPIKRTKESVNFCKKNKINYDLISSKNYEEFILTLSKYSGLVFMTGCPEPTPRVAIESKMLNCKFISQKNLIGVAHEEYFSLVGLEMIKKVKDMRDEALSQIVEWVC
jgi:hypothetical protein